MSTWLLPILHGGGGYPQGWLNADWKPQPQVVIGCILLVVGYLWLTGRWARRKTDGIDRTTTGSQRRAFIGGTVILLIALSPPLDDWADSYLLSAHMAQHMLMLFLAGPLWLKGIPAWMWGAAFSVRPIGAIVHFITRPFLAFVVGNLVILLWHMPASYDAALAHEPVHIGQHLSFLLAGLILWWPVVSPFPAWTAPAPLMQCLYLFLQTLPGSLLGVWLTYGEPGTYKQYVDAPRIFGIGLAMDQELAGLMMWVLAGAFYLLAITVVFFRWAGREEQKEPRAAMGSQSG